MIQRRSTARPANRRSRHASPRAHLLDVQIRTSTARRQRNEKVGKWVFNLVLLGSVSVAAVLGLKTGLDKFFFQNADYTLKRISLDLDNILTREEALEETGLREGENIFSVDLAKVEAKLKAIPQVASVHVERELPDHIAVTMTSRDPVAWVAAPGETGDVTASEKSMLVDATGYLMRPRHIQPEYFHLPVIYGVKSDDVQDGELLANEDLRVALNLIQTVYSRPESLLRIRTLDISKGYSITVVNDQNAHIVFAAANFDEQLAHLQKLLQHCEESGRTLEKVNLMVKRNTPVTFVVASAPPEVTQKSQPIGTSPKTRRN